MRKRMPSSVILGLVTITLLTAAAPETPAEAVRAELLRRFPALLAEKGIVDEKGQEIDGRLGRLIESSARAKGAVKAKDILEATLAELNYAPSNLAGFPAAAFDRPIGTTLASFGRTVDPANIDARPEGSACPVGGIGAGGFERLMNGNFSTWFIKLGWMVEDTVWADQFHVFVRTAGRTVARTLSTTTPPDGEGLASWSWGYPVGRGDYFALYPKSGFSYEENPELPVKLAVVQFSPVIAGNLKETSYPVALYKWIAVNPGREPAEVGLLLTWENMVGWEPVLSRPTAGRPAQASFVWDRRSAGNVNEFVEDGRRKGILFRREGQDVRTGGALAGTMAIATVETPGASEVSAQAFFDPAGDGGEVWKTFSIDGRLDGVRVSPVARDGQRTAAGLAVKLRLKPGQRLEVPFAVAWDFPYYEFERGVKHRKKYTAFVGAEGTNAFKLASEALARASAWERAIDDWQRPILSDSALPDWLKQALLNELYVLAETSVWDAETDLHTYLESVDYLMYGTTDVDSYCWHILKLWPELETANVSFIAGTVPSVDPSFRAYQYATVFPDAVPPDKRSYYWGSVKVPGMVPHDLGSPRVRPWTVLNAFDWQNANVWKDLNPKLPLRAYRDFLATGGRDIGFLVRTFQASSLALDTLERRFGDRTSHVPLNEGIPDQTYDTWRMTGESAYVGLLWLAGLKAAVRMGETLVFRGLTRAADIDIPEAVARYKTWYEAGRASLAKLWDERGGYFHIDARTDDIMADQLFGVWYSNMIGLEADDADPIVPSDRVRRALRTIFERNVLGFGRGLMGAVNGRTADGRQLFSQQGDEVWVGTSYAFASACALYGLTEEAMRTAYGVYHVVYSPFGQGLFFKTPEAYLDPEEGRWNEPATRNGERTFRAMKYMRPGAVWALYEALQRHGSKQR